MWRLGGAFADPATNLGFSLTAPIAGNYINVRGAGTQNPTTPDYTMPASSWTRIIGTLTAALHMVGFNGRPCLSIGSGANQWTVRNEVWSGLVLQASANSQLFSANFPQISGGNGSYIVFLNCLFDENGWVVCFVDAGNYTFINCEGTTTAATHGGNPAFITSAFGLGNYGGLTWGCNFHDMLTAAMNVTLVDGVSIIESVFAKNGLGGIVIRDFTTYFNQGTSLLLLHNTIDANGADGVNFGAQEMLMVTTSINNLTTNHTAAATFGWNVPNGSAAANALFHAPNLGNWFFGNTTDTQNLSLTTGASSGNVAGTNPNYAAQSTEGYGVSGAIVNAGYPTTAFPNSNSGATATQTFLTPGAVQPQFTPASTSRGARVTAVP